MFGIKKRNSLSLGLKMEHLSISQSWKEQIFYQKTMSKVMLGTIAFMLLMMLKVLLNFLEEKNHLLKNYKYFLKEAQLGLFYGFQIPIIGQGMNIIYFLFGSFPLLIDLILLKNTQD